MLTTEQSHATIAYQAFQIQQAAMREAHLVGLVQERDKLLEKGAARLKDAMQQVEEMTASQEAVAKAIGGDSD